MTFTYHANIGIQETGNVYTISMGLATLAPIVITRKGLQF